MWRATEIGGWQCDTCGEPIILFAEKDGNYCPKCGAYHGCEIAPQKWKVTLKYRGMDKTETIYHDAKTKDGLEELNNSERYVTSASAAVSWVEFKDSLEKENNNI